MPHAKHPVALVRTSNAASAFLLNCFPDEKAYPIPTISLATATFPFSLTRLH